jgi:hypothetical protein
MTTPHKHAAIIHAWADGETIEVCRDGEWTDIKKPAWSLDYDYRIKPSPVMLRHYTLKESSYIYSLSKNYSDVEDQVLKDTIKGENIIWLDEWHEASFKGETK